MQPLAIDRYAALMRFRNPLRGIPVETQPAAFDKSRQRPVQPPLQLSRINGRHGDFIKAC